MDTRNPDNRDDDEDDLEEDLAAAEQEPITKAGATPAGETQTIHEWAKRKGMAERFLASPGAFAHGNPLYQDFAQAKAFAAWADDTRVTEEQFDAAIAAAKSHDFR